MCGDRGYMKTNSLYFWLNFALKKYSLKKHTRLDFF